MDILGDEKFLQYFLAHLLRDSDFLRQVHPDLKPEVAGSNDAYQRVIVLCRNYFSTYGAAPDTLAFKFLDDLKVKGLLHETVHATVSKVLDELFALNLQNRDFILKTFNTFSRQQMAKSFIIPFSEDLKKGDFDTAERRMKELFAFRPQRDVDLGGMFSEDPSERINRRRFVDERRAWLLIPELDRRLDGLLPGQSGVWVSKETSAGKSAALQFIARSYAFQAMKVLIFTLEMSKDAWEDRLDQCICGLVKSELTDRERLTKSLRLMTKFGGQIWIKHAPPGTKMSELRNVADMIRNVHGFHPDALLVDYIGECGPEVPEVAGNLYATGAMAMDVFNKWLDEEQLRGWTAVQGQRNDGESVGVSGQKAAGSIAVPNKADLVLGISRTKTEAESGLTRIDVDKNREGPAKYHVTIQTDFTKMAFWKRAAE